MEIIELTPPSRVLIKLDFLKPFEAHNTAEFTFTPRARRHPRRLGDVRPQHLHGQAHEHFVSMDRLVGKDFEKGLAEMKAAAEK